MEQLLDMKAALEREGQFPYNINTNSQMNAASRSFPYLMEMRQSAGERARQNTGEIT